MSSLLLVRRARVALLSFQNKIDSCIQLLGNTGSQGVYGAYYKVLEYNQSLHYSFTVVCWIITAMTTVPIFFLQARDVFRLKKLIGYTGDESDRADDNQLYRAAEFLFVFVVWTEVTNYIRYPFYAHVLGPLWLRRGWIQSSIGRKPWFITWSKNLILRNTNKIANIKSQPIYNINASTVEQSFSGNRIRKNKWAANNPSNFVSNSKSNIRDAYIIYNFS